MSETSRPARDTRSPARVRLTILVGIILSAIDVPVPDFDGLEDGFDALVAFREVDAVPERGHLGSRMQGMGGFERERHV